MSRIGNKELAQTLIEKYGLDRNGKRVASGVYMVEVATEEGSKGVVCKIAIIN